eukprot:7577-Heterococcus_DN1.PRE.1
MCGQASVWRPICERGHHSSSSSTAAAHSPISVLTGQSTGELNQAAVSGSMGKRSRQKRRTEIDPLRERSFTRQCLTQNHMRAHHQSTVNSREAAMTESDARSEQCQSDFLRNELAHDLHYIDRATPAALDPVSVHGEERIAVLCGTFSYRTVAKSLSKCCICLKDTPFFSLLACARQCQDCFATAPAARVCSLEYAK